MFKNKDFYPTPVALIKKMMEGVDFRMIHSILEPSAGDGAIVEELKKTEEHLGYRLKDSFDIDCIEIDPELRHILKGKKFRVVHGDFLTYDTYKEYDLIIANFPFSDGCRHMLKAMEMQKKNGGAIICLLNAETLRNPYNNDRITLKRYLEEYNAEIEYIQGAFAQAERKTDVEVALIKVQLPAVKRESIILERLDKTEKRQDDYADTECSQLADRDFFKAIVTQYKYEVEAGINLIKEYRAMAPLILSEFTKDEETGEAKQSGKCILKLDLSDNYDAYRSSLNINDFIKKVRAKYWKALFSNPKFIGKLTGGLRESLFNRVDESLFNRVDELQEYDFSLHNIYELKIEIQGMVVKGIEDCIVELFDELSHKYHWFDETSKNIHYYNGWKTNKAWIINKKVIIPLDGFRERYYPYTTKVFEPTRYETIDKLRDMEKCFNYLDGGLTEAVDLEAKLRRAQNCQESKDIRLKYFTVTFYKKGTCHIVFNNEELLKKFNIFGSQHKGWLPPSYGKKSYEEMDCEEKSVIDDFEGREEYKKVLVNTKYYLFDTGSLNLLEDSAG